MGSLPESGGSTSSFTNTPQAGTDSYSYIEDYLLAHSELYNQAYDILTLDVMANDLGGKAKSLFSIDDGYGNQISDLSQTDLLTNSSFSTWQPTAGGHQIRIINGKIEYRLSDGHGGVRDVDSLNSGEIIADSFTYAIKLGNGTLSWARVNINLTGTNDGPVANADTGTTAENAVLTVDVLANDTDADDGAVLTVTAASAPLGQGTASVVGNQVRFDPGSAFDHLNVGDEAEVEVSYTITDEHGATSSSTLTITVTGTNDAAAITGTATGAVVEDSPTTKVSGDVDSTDVDGAADSWAVVATPFASVNGYGTYTVDASGHWEFTLDNANSTVDGLNDGQLLGDSFVLTTVDGTSVTVAITILGHTDVTALILPNAFNGTGDPNDFDSQGTADGTAITGGNGADTLYGGAGSDTINGGNGSDTIYAGSGNDTAIGGNQGDMLYGGSGNDTLVGDTQNDILIGGYGADTLTGGEGADIFKFLGMLDTNDTVTDFDHNADSFDFTGFDANSTIAGSQALEYGGSAATANGIWQQTVGGNTVLYADTDGNLGTVEFMVTLNGIQTVDFTDFAGVTNPFGLP